jgi:hypothetical protein
MQRISRFHGKTARFYVLEIKFVEIRMTDTNYVEILRSSHKNTSGIRITKNFTFQIISQPSDRKSLGCIPNENMTTRTNSVIEISPLQYPDKEILNT